jgi:hypothetical protein
MGKERNEVEAYLKPKEAVIERKGGQTQGTTTKPASSPPTSSSQQRPVTNSDEDPF